MEQGVQIVFDIGGTKTRVAAVVEGVSLRDVTIFETPPEPEVGLLKILSSIERIVGGFPVSAVCGGVKGVISDGVMYKPPHIVAWNGFPLGEKLKQALGAPVFLLNDTELVALGEYYHGAGKGESNMLYVTVSTGVGGAHVVNGEIIRGKYNAEVGHQMVDGASLESLVSGTAVQKKYGVSPKDLDDEAARNELADILARGLYDNVLHWSPEVIVLGGSMIVGKNAIPIKRVEQTLRTLIMKQYPDAPRITMAQLGDKGGLYGGVAYLKRVEH
ncbi:MAG: ROK family protein [Patescibacteria group bacterium UBA2163]